MESQRKFPYESIPAALNAALEHHRAGRIDQADLIYRQILVENPSDADALHLLGVIHSQRGQIPQAIDLISRAIKQKPDVAQFHLHLAENYRALRKVELAIPEFRRAIELAPDEPMIHNSFGALLGELRQFEAAIAEFRVAIELKPDFADAHSNLGAALVATGRLELAVASLQIALQFNPHSRGAHNNLGNALYYLGRIPEAIACFEKVAASNPNDSKIHANLALAFLLLGDFPRGWREHEWRLKVPEIVGTRQLSKPRWEGEPLNGKTILLHPEQGLGDMIQFSRFIPNVVAAGGRIILESPPELLRLFTNFRGISHLITRGQPLPEFDVHCPLLSLGYIFNIDAQNIPSPDGYLTPDPNLVREWATKIDADDSRKRVGLVWAGRPQHTNERNRSMKLAQFAPLADLKSIAFYSLQKGPAAAQLTQPPQGLHLLDLTADLHDFAATAAMIQNLDLVITVDTAVAHLAGAMGKPVWILLPWIADWRWLRDRTDSPWYKSARLFRQDKLNDWPGVLQKVRVSLQNELPS